ncbi:hypothetical protein SDC9_42064 [bioreactor metagenome]|uniref:Uncharacterized protein n=1 Tax=bioreactor metagenome TaxID=1076179 RepID=A0A644VWU7_9ZZZZ
MQFTRHSTTEVPLCCAAAIMVIWDDLRSTSNTLPKKDPLAPIVNSPGRNDCSTVPYGDDLVLNPLGVVGEN